MKLNYMRRFSAYVSTFYHSEYITILLFLTDIHADGLIRHHDLPLHFLKNHHYLSLELLTTIEIVKISEDSTQNVLEIYYKLPLPKVMCENIKKGFEYQMDIYFTTIIEPDIDYTYPNEY